VDFIVKDTVSAAFNYLLLLGCTRDTLNLLHDGRNGVNKWTWTSNNTVVGNQQVATVIYPDYGSKVIKLIVSNGVCSDTSSQTIVLDNELTAAFSFPEVICPEDRPLFVDKSVGEIISWFWTFGNGFTSTLQNPPPQQLPAPTITREMFYTIRLIVQNAQCTDTVSHIIKAVNTCRIAVPNAFTPNSDGRNDFLYPLNAYKADQLTFRVYNRFGQVIFETRDWTKKWDGTINGRQQPTGTYVWLLQYIDHDTGTPVVKKGTTVLIR
jgi:gliding motility-associated-like protein